MANVKLRIEINSDASNEALGQISTDNMEFANTSIQPNADGVFSAFPKLSNATSGINALTYGQELCFNDSDVLDNIDGFGAGLDDEENPVEVVWGIVNEDKTYNVTLTFTGATGLQNVIVYGDKESQQFPTRAIIDGAKEVFSDDDAWTIEFDEPSDTHTIQFTHWNRANYNAVLTLIDIMLQNYEVDIYNGLKSVESLSQSSADTTGIFYGSIENSGSAEILDKNGELGDLLTDGIIDNSNVPITILVNGKEVQHHISTDSAYNRNSKTLSIELGNRLNTLDVLKYKGYNYPDHSENLANLLFDVLSNLRYALFGTDKELKEEEFKEMLSSKYNGTGATLYEYLTWLEVEYPVIEANKTYREVLDEFCLIAQMQMYIDDNNNVKFVSARPIFTDTNFQAIHIPKKNMFSQLDYAVILKNKYDGVEASKTNVSDVTDYNTVVWSNIYQNIDYSSFFPLTISELNDKSLFTYNENSNIFLGTTGAYAFLKDYYFTVSNLKIPIKSNNNLETILTMVEKLLTDGDSGNFTLKYKKKVLNGQIIKYTADANTAYYQTSFNVLEYNAPSVNGYFTSETEESGYITPIVSTTYKSLTGTIGASATKTLSNGTSISITKREDLGYYDVSFSILVGQKSLTFNGLFDDGTSTNNPNPDDITVDNSTGIITFKNTTLEYLVPISLDISIYGNKRTISFEQVQANTENIELEKTKVSLGSSNLIQDNYVIDTIKTNITEDYKQGISNASVSISCNDYFDSNGRKVINWSKGEIPQVNQIVYFDNDLYKDQTQRYWKIKSRNFRKTGVPMVDLELEECRKWVMEAGLYYKPLFISWDTLIKNGDISVENNTITDSRRGWGVIPLKGTLKIQNGIEIIGKASFGGYLADYSNTYLEQIYIPNTVKTIELKAFESCSLLNKIIFEENSILEYIGNNSFAYNNSLKTITIPKSVKIIGKQAFYYSNNLTNIIFEKLDGWFIADSEDATSGTTVDISNPVTASTLLVETYANKYFINKT